MQITDVWIYRKRDTKRLKAYANIIFDNAFAVRDLTIMDGSKGLFVAMPSRKLPSGKYLDVAHPVTKEMRNLIQAEVLEAYRRVCTG